MVQFQFESEGFRTMGINGVFPVQRLADWRPRKSWCFISSAKTGKKTNVPAWRPWGREVSSLLWGGSAFFFYLGLQLFGWGPSTLRKAVCVNMNLTQKTLTETQNNVWINIWALCGLVKLTHKISHHISRNRKYKVREFKNHRSLTSCVSQKSDHKSSVTQWGWIKWSWG